MNLVPLTPKLHGSLRVRPHASFHFVQDSVAISLYGSEMGRAAHEFPIVFTAEGEGYFPAALLGVRLGSNLFVDGQGRWLAGYMPAAWRRSAFRLAKLAENEEWVLCLDQDCELVNDSEGQPLFDDQGKPTEMVLQFNQFLGQLETDRMRTLKACAALDRLGLITSWDLTISNSDGSTSRLDGLFKIDEPKISALSGEQIAELHAAQALPLLYGHLFSLHKLALLGQLAGAREQQQKQQANIKNSNLDLDQLFGIVEDDPFIF